MNITLTQSPMKVEAGTQSIPQLPRMANLPMALTIVSNDADFTGITMWTFTVAENHSQDTTPMLFVDSGFTVNNKTVSFDLITNTEEVADYLGSRMKRNAVAQLRGFKAGQTTAALTVSFWVTLCNIIPDGSSTTPTPIAAFYTAEQTDAAIAAALATIIVPTDLNELSDKDGLLFSGSYDDLSNKPTIPSDLNELTDDDGLLFSGSYDDLSNRPTIPSDLNELTDDDGLLFSGSYDDLSNKPTIPSDLNELTDDDGLLFSGSYNDLSNKPTIPSDLSELTDDDGLLFSGSYNDLSNKPTIPSDLNELSDEDDKLHGPIKEVATLPTVPTTGQLVRLTTADDTAKASPGVYMHDGVGWTCISYAAPYALGNLGATPSLSLIPGAAYTATVNAEITSFTVAFTRPGLASITLTNAGTLAVAQPAMAGRTSKLLAEGAWDGAATALSKALIEDDGTYIIVSAGGLA